VLLLTSMLLLLLLLLLLLWLAAAAAAAAAACVVLCDCCFSYPGAFNTTTGPLHWELIQRARANDNQVGRRGVADTPPNQRLGMGRRTRVRLSADACMIDHVVCFAWSSRRRRRHHHHRCLLHRRSRRWRRRCRHRWFGWRAATAVAAVTLSLSGCRSRSLTFALGSLLLALALLLSCSHSRSLSVSLSVSVSRSLSRSLCLPLNALSGFLRGLLSSAVAVEGGLSGSFAAFKLC
jgi:hypothetical protein